MEGLKKFIEKIQNSDEPTKKRWLIGLTAAAMVLVLGFWLLNIGNTVKDLTAAQPENNQPSFGTIFNNGLKILSAQVFSKLGQLFERTKSLNIGHLNFVPENLPQINPKHLP